MKKLKFKIQLIIGFSSVVIISIIIGVFSIFNINKIGSQTELIYLHPFTVSNSTKDININIYIINRIIQDVINVRDSIDLSKSVVLINYHDSLVNASFEIINERFLGDKQITEKFYNTYQNWKVARDRVIEIVKNRDIEEIEKIAISKEEVLIESLKKEAKFITDYAQNRADNFYQNAIKGQKRSFIILIGGILFLLILSVIIARFVLKELLEINSRINNYELKLRALNAARNKLYSIIAHDLRSPFNSILGFSELLHENIATYPVEEAEEFARQINSTAKHTLNLLDNLLFWSKSQTGQLDFNPEILHLQPIVQEIIEILNSSATLKKINLKNQTENIVVFADSKMLHTILRNLISNAIKFTDSGGKIDINAEVGENQVELTVSDNGVGMNMDTINKLFRIDSNITTNGTSNERGSGLGLILCKEFVEIHKGKIWVESTPKEGSSFHFTIPLSTEPKEIIVLSDISEDKTLKKLKILIVEDDETSTILITKMVEMFGKEILHAKTGNEAIIVFQNNPDIDLVLMDIQMPEMNGYEATRKIRKFNKEVVIIAQTAYGLSGDRKKALEAGCNDHISKPTKIKALIEIIEKHNFQLRSAVV